MFLSIIIPHYNIDRTLLERCLDSISAVDLSPDKHETIIVDDGSEIPPVWVMEKYDSTKVRLIQSSHGGPGAARNIGIKEATGRYIMFVDADDYLINQNELIGCIKILKKRMPQIMRYRYYVTDNSNTHSTNKRHTINASPTMSGAQFMANNNLPGSPCTYFFEKELAIKNGITFPAECLHEDEEFNTKLHLQATSLINSEATLYCYCIRPGSTTSNPNPEFEKKRISDMMHAIERIKAYKDSIDSNCSDIQRLAIDRKLNTLAVDSIVNMLYTGLSASYILQTCTKHLSPLSLYPIPRASYSVKYIIFRILANSRTGLKFLRAIIPNKKPRNR